MTGDRPSGDVTFLFTDIEGSSRLWEQFPDDMASALARHDAMMTGAIDAHGGYVFATGGDGFGAAFARTRDAVESASDAQRALHDADWAPCSPLRVRMAIHHGVTTERSGNYFGPVLNRCARLRDAGHGGQVLLSGAVVDRLTADGHEPDAVLLGSHRLRDLASPERIYQLLIPGLPERFAPLRTLDALPHNIPVQLNSFVGRADELSKLRELVAANRLVTVSGPGGVGKTRLVLQVAADLLDDFPGGTWFVDLSDATDGPSVEARVADAMKLREAGGRSVLEAMSERVGTQRTLLILDNCEHVTDSVADFAQSALSANPALAIASTSRQRLRLAGERVFPIGPLPATAPTQATVPDAGQLFIDRVDALGVDLPWDGNALATVQRICERLDGIPLAIELAAGRTSSLTLSEIEQRLSDWFALLADTQRRGPRHQRTLHATLEWGASLLDADDRDLLAWLSIFRGGFTTSAASAVWGRDALDGIHRLVASSFLSTELTEPRRFRLLQTTRDYAASQLPPDDATAARDRHASYFATVAAEIGTDRTPLLVRTLPLDVDDMRAALERAITGGDRDRAVTLAAVVGAYLAARWQFTEARSWLRRVVALQPPSSAAWVKVLSDLGHLELELGDRAAAAEILPTLVDAARLANDARGEAYALNLRGDIAFLDADLEAASEAFAESARLLESVDPPRSLAPRLSLITALIWRGNDALAEQLVTRLRDAAVAFELRTATLDADALAALLAFFRGQHDVASALLRAALDRDADADLPEMSNVVLLAMELAIGDRRLDAVAALDARVARLEPALTAYHAASVARVRALWCLARSDADGARRLLAEAFRLAGRLGHRIQLLELTEIVAGADGLAGPDVQTALCAALSNARRARTMAQPPARAERLERAIARNREALGERFDAAWKAGEALTEDEATAQAAEAVGAAGAWAPPEVPRGT